MAMTKLDLDALVPLYINSASAESQQILRPQLSHRINLIQNIWCIPPGSHVLEIGGGQGDCTLVLAAAVGETGHVDAVDPCSLDYGAPATVGEAQAFLKQGALGERMSFIQADPMEYLGGCTQQYDCVVMNNCLWYFDSSARIEQLLTLLITRKHAKKILIAEWSLEARSLNQVPHVLAALTRANREYLNPRSRQNIRTVVSPAWFRRWFSQHEVEVLTERMVDCPKGMMDGQWEVRSVLSERFRTETREMIGDERQFLALDVMRDAMIDAVRQLKGGLEDVESVMIWTVMV